MNIYTIMQHRYSQINRQVICFWIFLLPASLLLVLANFFRPVSVAFSQATLFIFGWISWTFGEYIAHRFWMHNRPETGKPRKITNHQYHHTHPTELKIKDSHRIMLLVPGIIDHAICHAAAELFYHFCRFLYRFHVLSIHACHTSPKMGLRCFHPIDADIIFYTTASLPTNVLGSR